MYFLIVDELLENLILAIFHQSYIQNSSAKKITKKTETYVLRVNC